MSSQFSSTGTSDVHALLEAFPDGTVIVDPEGRIVMVNSLMEDLFGYERGELIGEPMEQLLPEEVIQLHAAWRENYLAAPNARPMGTGLNIQARRRNGTEFPAEVALTPVTISGASAVCAVVRDVTEGRHAEELLRQREHQLSLLNRQLERKVDQQTRRMQHTIEELEAFTYSVSHDLRAPLRSIDGFTRILHERHAADLDEEGRDYLNRVLAATRRMGGLIDDLLNLSRLSRHALRRRRVNLSSVAKSVVEELRSGNPDRTVEVRIQPDLIAEADPRLARMVLANLIGNAWKFTRDIDHPVVEFGAETSEEPTFFVRDNGVGFDMRYADKLFNAFQRMHSEHEFPGFGVGLATVKRIINRHDGRIEAHSEPGKGTTFTFTLPPEHDSDDHIPENPAPR